MTEIMILRNDGDTLLGADDQGNLYDGQRVRVSFNDLDVVTVIAEDGLSFDRTTGYGDQIVSKSTVTREGFGDAQRSRAIALIQASEEHRDTPGYEPTELEISDLIDTWWETEKTTTSHGKVLIDAYVDGELTSVEKTIAFIDWTER